MLNGDTFASEIVEHFRDLDGRFVSLCGKDCDLAERLEVLQREVEEVEVLLIGESYSVGNADLDQIHAIRVLPARTVKLFGVRPSGSGPLDPFDELKRSIALPRILPKVKSENSSALFEVAPKGKLVLTDVHLVGGSAGSLGGGAVRVMENGDFQCTRCQFSNNSADYGGAIFGGAGSRISITSSQASENTAKISGGFLSVEDTARIVEVSTSVIEINQALFGSGGGIYVRAHRNLDSSSDEDDDSKQDSESQILLYIHQSRISKNSAINGFGGGIAAANSKECTVSATSFMENIAAGGGAVDDLDNHLTFVLCSFKHNTALSELGTQSVTSTEIRGRR